MNEVNLAVGYCDIGLFDNAHVSAKHFMGKSFGIIDLIPFFSIWRDSQICFLASVMVELPFEAWKATSQFSRTRQKLISLKFLSGFFSSKAANDQPELLL